jgi:ABC-type lipoprotein release transport system permease subunit
MPVLARAFCYLYRKKARTVLLSCMIIALCAGCLLALSLYRGTGNAASAVKETFGRGFAVSTHLPRDIPNADFAPFDQALLDKVLGIGGVREYSIESRYYMCFPDVTFTGGLWNYTYEQDLNRPDDLSDIAEWSNEVHGQSLTEEEYLKGMELMTHFTMIFGSTNTKLNENFDAGTFVLEQGRHIGKNDRANALISKQAAQASGLHLGGTITGHYNSFLYLFGDPDEIWAGPVDFTIVGIFDVAGYQPFSEEHTAEADIAANWIFADLKTFEAYMREYASARDIHAPLEYGKAIFQVENPADLERIVSRARKIPELHPVKYDVSVLDAHYRDAIRPLDTIHALSLTVVLLLLLAAAVTLALLFSLWGKSRRREIGIGLSLGFSKREILGQFLAECMILTVVSFAISCFAANLAAGPLGDLLLQSAAPAASAETLDAEELSPEERLERHRAGDYSMEELRPATVSVDMGEIDISLSVGAMAIVFALAAGIVTVALLRGVWRILNTPPRKILSEFW